MKCLHPTVTAACKITNRCMAMYRGLCASCHLNNCILMAQICCTSMKCMSNRFLACCWVSWPFTACTISSYTFWWCRCPWTVCLFAGLSHCTHSTILDALNGTAGEHISFGLKLVCVKVLGGKRSPLSGKNKEFYLLLRWWVSAFCLHFLQQAEAVREFGSRGYLIVSSFVDLQTATQVSRISEGKDSLHNHEHSCQVQSYGITQWGCPALEAKHKWATPVNPP